MTEFEQSFVVNVGRKISFPPSRLYLRYFRYIAINQVAPGKQWVRRWLLIAEGKFRTYLRDMHVIVTCER